MGFLKSESTARNAQVFARSGRERKIREVREGINIQACVPCRVTKRSRVARVMRSTRASASALLDSDSFPFADPLQNDVEDNSLCHSSKDQKKSIDPY
jgi:hypothetical protein